jgi:hypothetical protein
MLHLRDAPTVDPKPIDHDLAENSAQSSADINRPKVSDFDLPDSRERRPVVIRPLAGARGYRKVQSSKDVGMTSIRSSANPPNYIAPSGHKKGRVKNPPSSNPFENDFVD